MKFLLLQLKSGISGNAGPHFWKQFWLIIFINIFVASSYNFVPNSFAQTAQNEQESSSSLLIDVLEVQNTDIHDVMNLISQKADLNIVVDTAQER